MTDAPTLDKEGYLRELTDWNEGVAVLLAQQENINLGPAHWEVIKYIRNHYTKHNRVPELRELLRLFETNYGKEKSSRKYIYKLFPYGYGQQACKIAGMRQPKKLWLDV